MQKAKKYFAMILLITLFAITTVNAETFLDVQEGVQPRYVGVIQATANLSISSSGRADVHTKVYVARGFTASVTATLCKDSGLSVKSWNASGNTTVDILESHYISSGHSYYVSAAITVFDNTGKQVDSFVTESSVVSY